MNVHLNICVFTYEHIKKRRERKAINEDEAEEEKEGAHCKSNLILVYPTVGLFICLFGAP